MGKKKHLVYVAGSYRADSEWEIKQNIERAEKVAVKYWRAGYAVFCPHKNSAFMGGSCPDETWLEGGLVILKRCDAIVMMDGWGNSPGACKELEVAMAANIPFFFDIDPENLRLMREILK